MSVVLGTDAEYEAVIGLEVHVQLSTQGKLFSSDPVRTSTEPNSCTGVVSLGMPGSLPVVNAEAVRKAICLGLAVGGTIARKLFFSRKHYFYSDLPKGYQISQHQNPLITGGFITLFPAHGPQKKVRIHHMHLEEDAGKSIHDQDPYFSFIDLNRAGTSLLEIVSEPDLHSAEEAYLYVAAIRRLVRYLGVSEANMEEGHLRCDANVSIRPKGSSRLGTRTEIKNLNSLHFVKKAIECEVVRQTDLVKKGEKVQQVTMGYNAASGELVFQRTKEEAHDYRYFPEPDLPPVTISPQLVENLKKNMPPLPDSYIEKFLNNYHLPYSDVFTLIEDPILAGYFDELAGVAGNPKTAASWVIGPVRNYLAMKNKNIGELDIPPAAMARLLVLVEQGVVSHTMAAQKILPLLEASVSKDPEEIIRLENLHQESNTDRLQETIREVLGQHPDKVVQYHKGKKGLLGFFMGELMKKTSGKANPEICRDLITIELEKMKKN